MRLIDADALIPTQVHTVVVLKDGREQLESVLYAEQVDDAPTVEHASPWHRAEDGLPKEGQNVLTMDANEDMETATYDGEGFEDSYGFYVTDVLYWMPIEPPKEESNA